MGARQLIGHRKVQKEELSFMCFATLGNERLVLFRLHTSNKQALDVVQNDAFRTQTRR